MAQFIVYKATKEHAGEYQCEVDNQIGEPTFAKFYIRILCEFIVIFSQLEWLYARTVKSSYYIGFRSNEVRAHPSASIRKHTISTLSFRRIKQTHQFILNNIYHSNTAINFKFLSIHNS